MWKPSSNSRLRWSSSPMTPKSCLPWVLALEPARLEAVVHLANLLRATAQYDAALALLEPALVHEPASPELHLTLGSAWREKGDFEKAVAHYRTALAASPNYAPA